MDWLEVAIQLCQILKEMKRNEEQKNNDKNSVAFHPMQVISEINNKSKTNDTSAKAKKKMHQ